jgi:carboxymethylenebutenolidase
VIQAYLARPALPGRFPALVQVHENLGVTPHRQDVAGRLAKQGYVSLTPNLFSRVGGRPPQDYADAEDRRRKAFLAAPDEQAVRDILATQHYLASRPDVLPDRIGIIGFCLGGSLALIAASESACFKAFVDFYGALTKPAAYTEDWTAVSYLPLVPGLSCPIQVHVGTEDEVISESEVAAFEELLERHGRQYELYRYQSAKHAFHDDTDPRYSPDNAVLAEERTFRFLSEHL